MANPFISREDLGDYLGQDLSASDKALIAVDAACDICRTLAEQTFNEVIDETIVLDGTGTDALLLPESPVIDVTAVTENDEALVVDDDYKLNGSGVLLRSPVVYEGGWGDQWVRRVWSLGRQNIEVTYSHGYAATDLPRDVRMVALSLADRIFTQGNVSFESLGAYSVRYTNGAALDLTVGERAILRKYRGGHSNVTGN